MTNSIRRFFLTCSGATVDLLERPECKTELSRYAMMGAFVAMTAAFAALSGGFALYTGFKRLTLAIPVGLLWGGFIFTLDRFIISSIRKKAIDPDSSLGQKTWIKLGEITTALPRLILAAFIAVTVAVPLEMKYFEPEIEAQIAKTNLEADKATADQAAQGELELPKLEKELKDMDDSEQALRERRDLLREQRRNEVDGVKGPGSTGIPGIGPEARQRKVEYDQAQQDFETALAQNVEPRAKAKVRVEELRKRLDERIGGTRATMREGDGFLARFRALRKLAEDQSIENVSLFLIILLTLIETTPVLIKLFAKRGPYDDLLDAVEHKVHIAQQVEVSNFNSDTNIDLELYRMKAEARRQLESQLIRDTLSSERIEDLAAQDIENAQSEIAKATIGDWKWKQMKTVEHTT
ncbi:MAG TPA: DUF4407 domain-containing protein [Pyrinomonadaceae bacterium]|nr:DUF4407 domain-containing protein [Pyrinomonadaceae bacterium]